MIEPSVRSVGYVPHRSDLDQPIDRRRFPRYATIRGLSFDVVSAWDANEIIVLSVPRADVTKWVTAPSDRKIIVDMPDAFLEERRGFRRSARGLAKWATGEVGRVVLDYHRAVERLLERADAVVCATDEQTVEVSRHCQNVHSILDLHGEFDCLPPTLRPSEQMKIVWEGQTATLPAIRPVLPALRALAKECPVQLHLVTDLRAPRYMNRFLVRNTRDLVSGWGIDIRLHQWSVPTLTEVSKQCDIAIVPVDPSDPMAVGKPENRMRLFWRLGLPVIASSSPSHLRAATLAGLEGQSLCSTAEDWQEVLRGLHNDPEKRLTIALAGQATALTAYSEESLVQRWDQLFDSL